MSKSNKLFDYLLAVTRELKRRGVDERRSLLTLFADNNPHVRLQAAIKVYSVAPIEAKAISILPIITTGARMPLAN